VVSDKPEQEPSKETGSNKVTEENTPEEDE